MRRAISQVSFLRSFASLNENLTWSNTKWYWQRIAQENLVKNNILKSMNSSSLEEKKDDDVKKGQNDELNQVYSELFGDTIQKAKPSKAQSAKIKKVMEEFANGTLTSSDGKKVTDKKQALAIAYSEAGVDGE